MIPSVAAVLCACSMPYLQVSVEQRGCRVVEARHWLALGARRVHLGAHARGEDLRRRPRPPTRERTHRLEACVHFNQAMRRESIRSMWPSKVVGSSFAHRSVQHQG